jgi:hypothetical protein
VQFVGAMVYCRLDLLLVGLAAQQWVGARLQPRSFCLMGVYGGLRILSITKLTRSG